MNKTITIEVKNGRYCTFVGIIEMLLKRMKDLPEKPDWYDKVNGTYMTNENRARMIDKIIQTLMIL